MTCTGIAYMAHVDEIKRKLDPILLKIYEYEEKKANLDDELRRLEGE